MIRSYKRVWSKIFSPFVHEHRAAIAAPWGPATASDLLVVKLDSAAALECSCNVVAAARPVTKVSGDRPQVEGEYSAFSAWELYFLWKIDGPHIPRGRVLYTTIGVERKHARDGCGIDFILDLSIRQRIVVLAAGARVTLLSNVPFLLHSSCDG